MVCEESEMLADIPEFPELLGLDKNHKNLLQRRLKAAQPVVSELTFSYLWSWKPQINTTLSRLGDILLVAFRNAKTRQRLALPPVAESPEQAVSILPEVLGCGVIDAFARIPAEFKELLSEEDSLLIEEQRDRADYVHPSRQLIDLPGQQFHSKRNHIRQFWKSCPHARYRAIDTELAGACIDFTRRWLAGHPKKHLPGLQRETEACVRMLENLPWLGLTGGVILDAGHPVAFALGEELNEDTFVVRVEKALMDVPGSYQVINREFISHAAVGYRWVNREQDLGIAGLRKAKKSYSPHHLVHKYRISRA